LEASLEFVVQHWEIKSASGPKTRAFVGLVNIASKPISICPGNLSGPDVYDMKMEPPGMVFSARYGPLAGRCGESDATIILQSGEVWGRILDLDKAPKDFEKHFGATGFFTIFQPGRDGKTDSHRAILAPAGVRWIDDHPTP